MQITLKIVGNSHRSHQLTMHYCLLRVHWTMLLSPSYVWDLATLPSRPILLHGPTDTTLTEGWCTGTKPVYAPHSLHTSALCLEVNLCWEGTCPLVYSRESDFENLLYLFTDQWVRMYEVVMVVPRPQYSCFIHYHRPSASHRACAIRTCNGLGRTSSQRGCQKVTLSLG